MRMLRIMLGSKLFWRAEQGQGDEPSHALSAGRNRPRVPRGARVTEKPTGESVSPLSGLTACTLAGVYGSSLLLVQVLTQQSRFL